MNELSEVTQEKKEPIDKIARAAYETRKSELWRLIKDCFTGKDHNEDLLYMDVQQLNERLRSLREYGKEYNEISNRLGSRDYRIEV
jgi:hypothetical protein